MVVAEEVLLRHSIALRCQRGSVRVGTTLVPKAVSTLSKADIFGVLRE